MRNAVWSRLIQLKSKSEGIKQFPSNWNYLISKSQKQSETYKPNYHSDCLTTQEVFTSSEFETQQLH